MVETDRPKAMTIFIQKAMSRVFRTLSLVSATATIETTMIKALSA